MAPIEKFLIELPLFKSFSSTELRKLIEKSELRGFAPHEKIIHFGQPGRFLGIVVEGEAEAVVAEEMKVRQRLGWLRRGDFLGEMSLLTGEPTSADVISLEECQVLLIPQKTFSAFIAVNSNAIKVIVDVIMIRINGQRTLIFGDVLVRLSPDFLTSMHVDTDEANAASLSTGMEGYITGVEDRM